MSVQMARQPVEAERLRSTSFDVSRTAGTVFIHRDRVRSRINDPLHIERSPADVLSTLPDPTTNVGLELWDVAQGAILGQLRPTPTCEPSRPSTRFNKTFP